MIKIARNDPCHCGSGKKYKKCCLRADQYPEPEEPEPRKKGSKMQAKMLMAMMAGFEAQQGVQLVKRPKKED